MIGFAFQPWFRVFDGQSGPSFEQGRPRRSNHASLPQEIGAAGREVQARQRAASRQVKPFRDIWSDLPRCADFKVARHLLDRLTAPSSKEGIAPFEISARSGYTFVQ